MSMIRILSASLICALVLTACQSRSESPTVPPSVVAESGEHRHGVTPEGTDTDEPATDELQAQSLDVGLYSKEILFAEGNIWLLKQGGWLIKVQSVEPHQQIRFEIPAHARDILYSGEALWIITATPGEPGILIRFNPQTGKTMSYRTVGQSPFSLTYGSGFLWVSDIANQHLIKLDGRDGSVKDKFALDYYSQKIAYGDDRLWAIDTNGDAVAVYNDSGSNQLARYRTGKTPVDIAFDEERAWIINREDNFVTLIPFGLSHAPTTIELDCSPHRNCYLNEIIINELGAFVASAMNDRIWKLDLNTGAILKQYETPVPIDMAYDGTHIWVINGDRSRNELGHTLTRIRP